MSRDDGLADPPALVRLTNVPAVLFLESQDHQNDLIREFELMDLAARAAGPTAAQPGSLRHSLPHQVTEYLADIHRRFADVRTETREQALDAIARGEEGFVLLVPIRPGMLEALRRWFSLVEEADRLCEQGAMLTIPARPPVQRLRRWYVEAISWCLAADAGEQREARYPDVDGTRLG